MYETRKMEADMLLTIGRRAPQMRINEKERIKPILAERFSYAVMSVGQKEEMTHEIHLCTRQSFRRSRQHAEERPHCAGLEQVDDADVRSWNREWVIDGPMPPVESERTSEGVTNGGNVANFDRTL